MTRTRFAPSPTGFLHIGGLRTAAYSYALAKHFGGEFLLRIEDTDQKREVPGAAAKLYDILRTFGLNWDEEPVVQSRRAKDGVYIAAAKQLVDAGFAFYCQCSGRDAKHEGYSTVLRDPCRDLHLTSGAIKIRIPDGEVISYRDYVQGKDISWKSDIVPDTVLLKSEELGQLPTYHLAAAIDDLESNITHVLRGHDWQPSTPVHLYVYKFLGKPRPEIGHLTDILDPEGGKLSKRKGNVSCEQFLHDGYLTEAILNFVILMGWAPKDNQELFLLPDFVSAFDPHGFQKANPVFSTQKLDWFNGHYLRTRSNTELVHLVKPFVKIDISQEKLVQIVPLIKDRLVKLSDFNSLTTFFATPPAYTADLWPDPGASLQHLQTAVQVLTTSAWTKSDIDSALLLAVDSKGWKRGDFFMSLRIAICGSRFTPPLSDTMLVLGQGESLSRIEKSLQVLSQN
jgi:glutamyl-tRNA synthetase